MDDRRFDHLVKTLRTRRSTIGLVAGIAALLGLGHDEAAAKKCKQKCGPCKRCMKGKCKPKPGSPRCGPCSVCEQGRCMALCPPDDCDETDDGSRCLLPCTPPCDVCSSCNRVEGVCEDDCEREHCTTNGCRVPCASPCGECSVCDLGIGECEPLCAPEACDSDLCDIPCSPPCASDEVCLDGSCYPVCAPPCASDQGCVAGAQGHECVPLAGNCPANADFCATGQFVNCQAGGGFGICVTLNNGGSYCYSRLSGTACETDIDCQNRGFGANARCIVDCLESRGSACVAFATDGL